MVFQKDMKGCRPGQATLEFTFGMAIAALILMGMVQVLVWTGQDLAKRREAHEKILTNAHHHGQIQTQPTFYHSTPIFAAAESNIFGDEF
jgi:hypothetical protein